MITGDKFGLHFKLFAVLSAKIPAFVARFTITTMDARLFGIWESDPSDASAIEQYGRVRLHFFATGDLTYTICHDNLDQVIRLKYTISGNTITTQQPSSPLAERTEYVIEVNGRLALTHNGILSWYVRRT